MSLILKSFYTLKLKKKNIVEICKLKDKEWKYGLKSQIKFFNANYKKRDIHNLMFLKKNLIGYTALRKRPYTDGKHKKSYLLFDTLIVDKMYRKKNFAANLMKYNNYIIKKNKKLSFLVYKKKRISFYKKFNWKVLNKKKINILDYDFKSNGMFYNFTKNDLKKNKFEFYFNSI